MPCIGKDMSALEAKIFGGKYADVTLAAGDQEFKVHKNILSERSQFFDAIFHTPMAEKDQTRIELKDLKAEVFKQMLIYIYNDTIYDHDDILDLYLAADKVWISCLIFFKINYFSTQQFGIDDLKICCKEYLTENMTQSMICPTYQVAILLGDAELKNFILNYVKELSYLIIFSKLAATFDISLLIIETKTRIILIWSKVLIFWRSLKIIQIKQLTSWLL